MEAAPLNTSFYKEALIVLGAAAIVIPLFHRLHVSSVLGFMLVGVAVGPFGLASLGRLHRLLTVYWLPAPLRDRVQLIDSAGAQNQVGLLAGKRERGGLADATRCARDDDDRPLEPHVGILGAAVKSGHEGAHVPC